jgi:Fuc2NAc and GlcNAc transferase
MHVLLLIVATALVSAVLTSVVRKYSLQRELLDIPNERSSHSVPTPRGGGLAIVAALLVALTLAWLLEWIPGRVALALVPGGIVIAAIGWIDDHHPRSAAQRLVAHIAAAAWAMFVLGGLPVLRLGTAIVPLGLVGSVFAILTIVWLTNLYNFMDGIDGIAATEAVAVGVGAAALALLSGVPSVAVAALLVAAAAIGFLGWNWQPARIFMGDVGSGFLGYVLAVTAIVSERGGGPSLLLWGLMLGVFVVDTTLTLLRRALGGERLSAAHRRHAYQRAVQSGMSHSQVTTATLVLNSLLIGLAAIGHFEPQRMALAVFAGCALLIAAYLFVEWRRPMFSSKAAAEHTR